MQVIERKKGSFKAMIFNVNLAAIGKTPNDVVDIFFVIKSKMSDEDTNAIMIKNIANGISINAESQVIVPWAVNEYENFTIDKIYDLGVFLQFDGDPVADEDVKETFKIKITQDFLHDS